MIPYQLITLVVTSVALCVCSMILGSMILWSLREELTMFGVLFSVLAFLPCVTVVSMWLGGPAHGPFGVIYFMLGSSVIATMFPMDNRTRNQKEDIMVTTYVTFIYL